MDFYRKLEAGIKDARSNLQSLVSSDEEKHSHTHPGHECLDIHPDHHRDNRHGSFAPVTTGGAKWHVDGASYFWAVSEALECEFLLSVSVAVAWEDLGVSRVRMNI